MPRTLIVAAVSIAALLAGGCGSVCNLVSKDPEVFGGPAVDAQILMTPLRDGGSAPSGNGDAYVVAFIAADMVASCVVDVATIPLALWLRRKTPEEGCSRTSDPRVVAPSPAPPSDPVRTTGSRDDLGLVPSLMEEYERNHASPATHSPRRAVERSLADLGPLGLGAVDWGFWETRCLAMAPDFDPATVFGQ
jgi:hypothetical protein